MVELLNSQNVDYEVVGVGCWVLGVGYRVLGFRYRVSGVGGWKKKKNENQFLRVVSPKT